MKTIEEKLAYFEKTVLSQAMEDRDRFSDALEEKRKEALSHAESQYRREAKVHYHKDLEETHKQARLIVSNAKNEGQNALTKKRNAIMDEVFQKLELRLIQFTKEPEYEEYFTRKLEEALRSGTYQGVITVVLTPTDMAGKGDLVRAFGAKYQPQAEITLEEAIEDMLGGCKVKIPSFGRVIDNSMRADVDAQRQQFLSWSKLEIK